jgi:hypothetical protein
MRFHRLFAFPLLAGQLAAQQRPIAPAASVLFRAVPAAQVQDTVKVDAGIPQNEGAFFGMVVGAATGYLFMRALEGGPGVCTDVPSCGGSQPAPTANRVTGAVLFAVAGAFIGGALARPRTPKVKAPKPPPAPEIARAPRVDTGMTWRQGAKLGGALGAISNVVMAARFGWKVDADAGQGVDPIALSIYGALGCLFGMLIGGGIAGAH